MPRDPLRRRRHLRWRLGTRARLLHDDWRPQRSCRTTRSDFPRLAPGQGDTPPTKVGDKVAGGTAVNGYLHCGPVGAGHFVKMVHNGIEYGIMQAYGEGFDIFKRAEKTDPKDTRDYDYQLDLGAIAELWRRQRRRLVAARPDGDGPPRTQATRWPSTAASCKIRAKDGGPVMAAVEQAVPADVLTASLYTRFRSRQDHTFAEKVLSAMREKFGGHVEQPPVK